MIKIELNDKGFFILGKVIDFPVSKTVLNQLFGEERYLVLKYGHKHTWDKFGIVGHSNDGELIESLYINFIQEDYDFSPHNIFLGEILIEDQNIFEYRKNNVDKLFKSYKEDDSGKFVIVGISCWFNINETDITGVEIQKDDGKSYQPVLKLSRQTPISVNEKYSYLINLWEFWKDEILKIVPIDNKYFNLIYGITESDVVMYSKLEDEIIIPDELLAFYKIYNVEYNGITSAISFSCNNWQYDLIPFKQIKVEWEGIQDLQFGEEVEEENLELFSDKVISYDYANPLWIPFAEGKNGDYLLYDTDPSETGVYGQIIELQNESWERNVVASSLSELLEKEITQLKNGFVEKYDFILGKEIN